MHGGEGGGWPSVTWVMGHLCRKELWDHLALPMSSSTPVSSPIPFYMFLLMTICYTFLMGILGCPKFSPKAEEHSSEGKAPPSPFLHSDSVVPPGPGARSAAGWGQGGENVSSRGPWQACGAPTGWTLTINRRNTKQNVFLICTWNSFILMKNFPGRKLSCQSWAIFK